MLRQIRCAKPQRLLLDPYLLQQTRAFCRAVIREW